MDTRVTKFVVAFVLLFAALAAPGANGQRQTVNVLIDASYAPTGNRLLDQLRDRLEPRVREALNFERRTVPSTDIRSALGHPDWKMAIVSNSAIVAMGSGSSTVAFEMPFVFRNTGNVLTFQRSATGRAALGTLPAGVTGLVYLNAGISLVAGRTRPISPEDLKGRSVAVYSPLLQEQSKLVGDVANPASPRRDCARTSGWQGRSALMSSANPTTWDLDAHRFVLSSYWRPGERPYFNTP